MGRDWCFERDGPEREWQGSKVWPYWSRCGLIRGSVSLWRQALRSHVCSIMPREKDHFLLPMDQRYRLLSSFYNTVSYLVHTAMSNHDDNDLNL